MPRLLHLADLHLGYRAPQAPLADEPRRDRLLDDIADHLAASSTRPDLLLIAGDLFDSHQPPRALVQRVIAAIKRLQDRGVSVITVPGNHDELTYSDSVFRACEREWPGFLVTNTSLQAPVPLVVRGSRIYLISMAYDARVAQVQQTIESFPAKQNSAPHICLLHAALDETHERCLQVKSETLFAAGYDYTALGHRHTPFECFGGTDGGSLIAYAGMIASRQGADPGCEELLFVDLEPGYAPSFSRQILPSASAAYEVTFDCGSVADLYMLQQRLQEELAGRNRALPLRLALCGELRFAVNLKRLVTELSDDDENVILDTTALCLSTSLLKRFGEEDSLRGHLARRYRRELSAATPEERQNLQQALLVSLEALSQWEDQR